MRGWRPSSSALTGPPTSSRVRIVSDPKVAAAAFSASQRRARILFGSGTQGKQPDERACHSNTVQGPLETIAGGNLTVLVVRNAFGSGDAPFHSQAFAEIPRVDIAYSHADDDGVEGAVRAGLAPQAAQLCMAPAMARLNHADR